MSQTLKVPAMLSGGVFLILVAFYWPFLSGQGSFFLSDATFWLEPQARYLRESIWSGRFPLWNPWNYCGMPQIAIPFPSLFYLPDWLFVLFPFNPALALSMIFHQLLALVGMYAMLRNFKMSEMGSAGGAIIYSLSGYMFGLSNNHSLVAGAAWFPILFLMLSNVVSSDTEKIRFKYCLASSLSLLMIIASGRPEVFVPSILISTSFALYRAISGIKAKTTDVSALIWLFRSLFLGVVFAMPIILPMGEWLASSRRALGLFDSEVFLYSANWFDLLSCIIGPSLGDLRLHGNPFRPLVSFSNLPAYVACGYIGPIAFLLALIGLSDKSWSKKVRFVIATLILLSLIASLGDTTPIAKAVIHTFPAVGFIRFPIKLLFIPIWCIAILAARGFDCISRKTISNAVLSMYSFSLLIGAGTLLLASHYESLIYLFRYPVTNLQTMLKAQESIGMDLLITGTISVVFFCAFSVARKYSARVKESACMLFICSPLIFNSFSLERIYAPPDHFEMPSFVAEQIKKIVKAQPGESANRALNLTYERLTVPEKYRFEDPLQRTIGELQYHRQIIRPNTNIDLNIPEAFGFEGSMNGEYFNVFYSSYFKSNQTIKSEIEPPSNIPLKKFAEMSSSRFLMTQIFRMNNKWEKVKDLVDSNFTKIVEDFPHNIRIYEIKKSTPLIYLCTDWTSPSSHNEILNTIVSTSDGWSPTHKPFIEAVSNSTNNPIAQPESIKIVSRTPECLVAKINTTVLGCFIVVERNYPGWKSYVDGNEVKTLVVNGFFKGVLIKPGNHTVQLKYEPQSLYLGFLLSALGLILVIGLYRRIQNKVSIKSDTTT